MHDLQKAGDFITANVNKIPIVVVKDKNEKLKAPSSMFVSIEELRSFSIKEPVKLLNVTTTLGHGTLMGISLAPHSSKEKDFCKKRLPLTKLNLETLGPFIFISTSKNPVPFSQLVRSTPQFYRGYWG